ncbi:MAG TPA: hypothetical protein V6C81_14015 [Planktothrix sp.]|jgi:hypothetical protein
MLDGLDKIPWNRLQCAFGTAEDVPGALRDLQKTFDEGQDTESALSYLFTSIWHQGTVYEATSYAVPFLFELAKDEGTPDRTDILNLLAAIATGTSYWEVHDAVWTNLSAPTASKRAEIEANKERERIWVAKARKSVEAGFDILKSITRGEPEIRLAAAHVLAQFPERSDNVGPILLSLLQTETVPLYRAGLLLLLGQVGDQSSDSVSALRLATTSNESTERLAAAVSIAKLQIKPIPGAARELLDQALSSGELHDAFAGLPWDWEGEIDDDELSEKSI